MTTIAIKDGIIAYDSRCRQGDTITSDDSNKHFRSGGVDFFMSGNVGDQEHLIEMYFGRPVSVDYEKMGINAYAVYDGTAWLLGVCKVDGFWKSKVRFAGALGSGTDHALTAMDMGATANCWPFFCSMSGPIVLILIEVFAFLESHRIKGIKIPRPTSVT